MPILALGSFTNYRYADESEFFIPTSGISHNPQDKNPTDPYELTAVLDNESKTNRHHRNQHCPKQNNATCTHTLNFALVSLLLITSHQRLTVLL